MARTILEGKNALVLGVDCAPGRSCAQQLSRAGCRVVLAGLDHGAVTRLADQIQRKGGSPTEVHFPQDRPEWEDILRQARDRLGHLHMVVNARPLSQDDQALEDSELLEKLCADLLIGHGPTKLLTLWPEERGDRGSVRDDAWHSVIHLGPRQQSDAEPPRENELRAAAVADSVVFLFQLPFSACPRTVKLGYLESPEKKPKTKTPG